MSTSFGGLDKFSLQPTCAFKSIVATIIYASVLSVFGTMVLLKGLVGVTTDGKLITHLKNEDNGMAHAFIFVVSSQLMFQWGIIVLIEELVHFTFCM